MEIVALIAMILQMANGASTQIEWIEWEINFLHSEGCNDQQ
jgi:hypothetical protein